MQHYRNQNSSSTSDIAQNRVVSLDGIGTVKAHVDFACNTGNGGLVLIGWLFDPQHYVHGFSILQESQRGFLNKKTYTANPLEHDVNGTQSARVTRPDVAFAMSSPEDPQENQYGFVLVIPEFPSDGKIGLVLKNGQYAILSFVAVEDNLEIKRVLELCWQHSGDSLLKALHAAFGDEHPLMQQTDMLKDKDQNQDSDPAIDPYNDTLLVESYTKKNILTEFNIDLALKLKRGLIVIGWVTADESDGIRINLSDEKGWEAKTLFRNGNDGTILSRIFRPDLRKALSPQVFDRGMHGFVLYWPFDTDLPANISVSFDGSRQPQPDITLFEANGNAFSLLRQVWLSAGDVLSTMASHFQEEPEFTSLLEDVESAEISQESHGFSECEQVLLFNNRALILNGWIAKSLNEIERVELVTDQARIDITSKISRYVRPDLFADYPWSNTEALGFLCVLDDQRALACDIRLKIVCHGGQSQVICPAVRVTNWPMLGKFINEHTFLAEPLLKLLAAAAGLEDTPQRLEERMRTLRYGSFLARYSHLPMMLESPETVVAAIDRGYPLGDAGLLIFGWWLTPKRKPTSVTIRSAEGDIVDITDRMSPLVRRDVSENYRKRFPQVNEWCGFVCLVPLPTRPGEARAVCFDFGDFGDGWLKIPTKCSEKAGVELIKEIIGSVPDWDKLRGELFDIFDNGLGQAIEAINERRPMFSGEIKERQFGRPPQQPSVSVIVPLYGRYDFLRHQLAHFADDRDFENADLIYVVDDPSIIAPTSDMATAYYQLFRKPFRVVFYGQNLGFAGANNIGVKVARADTILLLNSDVIPKQPGWLATLQHALDTLPEAGAVGPLLLFADDSIQHAGMRPKLGPSVLFHYLPGFLLNTHPGKGQVWMGPDEPSEHPLLTAACLMLKKQDYLDQGGLDEGYVIGDFEDSDLCLALRGRGKRLWLVPEAKLWHLERQSQNIKSILDYRQLLTLYNGWRYYKKIQNGLISDPTQFEV